MQALRLEIFREKHPFLQNPGSQTSPSKLPTHGFSNWAPWLLMFQLANMFRNGLVGRKIQKELQVYRDIGERLVEGVRNELGILLVIPLCTADSPNPRMTQVQYLAKRVILWCLTNRKTLVQTCYFERRPIVSYTIFILPGSNWNHRFSPASTATIALASPFLTSSQ